MIITWRNRIITAVIFLVFLVAVIEGAGYLYTFNKIQNAAEWSVRYAVTGSFERSYCDDATSTFNLLDADLLDGDLNCMVPVACDKENPVFYNGFGLCTREDVYQLTSQLINWARLPSIRDKALIGAAGIHINLSVSGNYLKYLETHDRQWLGTPDIPGYFHVTICSRPYRIHQASRFHIVWDGDLPLCFDEAEKVFMDDAGISSMDSDSEQDQRVKVMVVVFYTYTPVTPFLRQIWPTIPIFASREDVVVGYTAVRISGFGDQIPTPITPNAPTPTNGPTPTNKPTSTLEPTPTWFPTVTPLPKDWLSASQGHVARNSALSFFLTIVLVLVVTGGLCLGKLTRRLLKPKQS
ncbi:MAG: TadE/TadG family type IV pilus assembly protein [Chloroflexota bacterium]